MFQLYGKNYYMWNKFPKFGPLNHYLRIHYVLREEKSNP
jgi:hypothetical protein